MVNIAVLPGDGIGKEIIPQAVAVLEAVGRRFGIELTFHEAPIGGTAIDLVGRPLPPESLAVAKKSDAVLLGAVGGPKWEGLDYAIRPERALLGLREALGLYANLRPAKLSNILVEASPLRREVVEGTDIMVVRELTGGIYFGRPKGIEKIDGQERGVNTEVYTTVEIDRIARVAFEIARQRRKLVTSVDKANVLESSELWRRVVTTVHKDYQDVTLRHIYVDNCAMQLVKDPRQFDVIVTTNMFGDILSDEAAQIVGSIGLLPSASVGDVSRSAKGSSGTGRKGLFEPIHGSAPDIAGQDKANPLATILSAALLLRYTLGHEAAASAVERAVDAVLQAGYRTADIATPGTTLVGTAAMGQLVVKQIERATHAA